MRKIVAFFILGVVTIGAVWWLANYLSTGTIAITAGKDDTITLQETSGDKQFTKIATGSLSATVKHGQYAATVKNGLKTTIQVINFNKGHKTLHYAVSLTNLLSAEPVVYESAQGLETTSSQLVYLDDSSHTLHKIDDQNNLQEVNDKQFQVVKWANPSFGVGQSSDGNLYTISDNLISKLPVPISRNGKSVNFDVSPNKRIYVSYGTDVYAGNQVGNFKKIYTATSSNPVLAAGTSGVAVSDSKYGGRASDISKPLLATVSTSGKITKKNIEAEKLIWSPNGQYLAVVNQASPTIYDSTLRQVAVVPTSTVVGQFEWLNNTTLLYVSSYQVWTYDLSDQKTQLLAGVSATDFITGTYINSGGSYIYITTVNSFSSKPAIKRIGLKGQQTPNSISSLGNVLSVYLGNYSKGVNIGLINFSSTPVILVQPTPGNPIDYIQQTKSQLQQAGLDPNQFQFRLISSAD